MEVIIKLNLGQNCSAWAFLIKTLRMDVWNTFKSEYSYNIGSKSIPAMAGSMAWILSPSVFASYALTIFFFFRYFYIYLALSTRVSLNVKGH